MTRERYIELLGDLDRRVLEMGNRVSTAISQSIDALEQQNIVVAHRLIDEDSVIDTIRQDIEVRSFQIIATQQPAAGDLRRLTAVVTIAAELERIADYCEGIAKLTLRMAAEPINVSTDTYREMAHLTTALLSQVLIAFQTGDIELAGRVWMRDDAVDALYEETFRCVLGRMAAEPTFVRRGTYLLWVAHNLERMADRITNLAESVAFIVTGDTASFREELRKKMLPV